MRSFIPVSWLAVAGLIGTSPSLSLPAFASAQSSGFHPAPIPAPVDSNETRPNQTNPDQTDPNQTDPPGRGWEEWQPIEAAPQANFTAGFSSAEVNGVRELQTLCARLSTSSIEYPNWFRLSTLLDRIGTGRVEYGCWIEGQFAYTIVNTAVRSDLGSVNQLLVDVGEGNQLAIYEEPTIDAPAVGLVGNGETVIPSSFPALVVQNENRNWVYLTAPFEGWILQGTLSGQSNLRLPDRH